MPETANSPRRIFFWRTMAGLVAAVAAIAGGMVGFLAFRDCYSPASSTALVCNAGGPSWAAMVLLAGTGAAAGGLPLLAVAHVLEALDD